MKIYICSPYRGDTKQNVINARKYCRAAYEAGHEPIAPHLFFTQFLNEHDVKERAAGLNFGLQWLRGCDEVWVYNLNGISHGMRGEIAEAERLGINIIYIDKI